MPKLQPCLPYYEWNSQHGGFIDPLCSLSDHLAISCWLSMRSASLSEFFIQNLPRLKKLLLASLGASEWCRKLQMIVSSK